MSEPGSGESDNVGRCPICGKATVADYRPFCSRRCADVDLSRWLRGAYAIPSRETDDAAPEEATEPSADGKEGSR